MDDATKRGKNFASGIASSVSAGTIALGNLMSTAVMKAGQAIMDFGTKGLDYNRTMEDYVTNFRTLLGGSSEAANQMVGALEEMAAKTPFAMGDLASSTQTLLSFGIESDKVVDIMTMLGDISMGNSEKFSSLSRAFGQISAAGKLSGEDLNQLIDQGFNPLQTIAETTGASMADLKAVMSGQKTSKDFNQLMKDAQKEVKKFGDNASEGAKMLVQMGEDGAISADLVTQVFEKVTAEGGLFYNAMEESSKTTSGMISTLGDNWNALMGSVFQPAHEMLKNTILPTAISAVDTLQSAYNEGGLSGMFSAVASMATELGTQLVTALSDAGTKIYEALPGIVETVTTWVTEKKADITTQATELFNGFTEALPGVTTQITEALPGILTAVTTWFVESKTSMIEQAITMFTGIVDGLTSAISQIGDQLPTIITTITTWVTENAPSLVQQGMDLFNSVISGITAALPGVAGAALDIVTGLAQGFVENLPAILVIGSSILSGVLDGIAAAIPTIAASVLGVVTEIQSKFGEIDWTTLGTNLIDGLKNGLTTAATESAAAIQGVFTSIWDGIKTVLGIHSPSTLAAEAGGYIVEGFANGVTTGETTFGEKIKGVFTSIWNGIKSIFGFGNSTADTESDANKVGESVVSGLANGLGGEEHNSAVTNATSLGERVLEALKTALDVVEGVSNAAATVGASVIRGVSQGVQDTEFTGSDTIASDIMSTFVTALTIQEGVAQYFKPVGKAIAEGVAKGITDNKSKITTAAENAAKDAYDAAMEALDAHSPSRVMMEVGRYFAEGFALGITNNTGMVSAAARGMSNGAVYGSYMGDMHITQNISAVAMSENELAMQTANALQLLRFA